MPIKEVLSSAVATSVLVELLGLSLALTSALALAARTVVSVERTCALPTHLGTPAHHQQTPVVGIAVTA
eukprot:CAMPEP_0175173314 /NCGR_PEP_ID=MMETSP0087-20121206/31974_1 /TAXON_ID=136419 /ORGANISM="Unknown Unknown, Strain D1" /LENGTH=68 /DNA_ID=CAMNT_0016464591 /DNA_START=289 /DNA_END=492 /DNA_ORIENTATION=-